MLRVSIPDAEKNKRWSMLVFGLIALETILVTLALVPAQLWTRLLPNSETAALDGPFPPIIAMIIPVLLYLLPTVIGFLCRSWQRALLFATFYLVAPTQVMANVSLLELFAELGGIGWLARHLFDLR